MEYLLILLGAIAAGFVGAGVILIANLILGGRLPKWTMAIAAGVAMLGMTLYLEYDWFDRRSDQLPENVQVVWQDGARQIWRPWTYLFPLTTRFIAIDLENVGTHPEKTGLRLTDILFVQRWTRDRLVKAVVDCERGQSAQVHNNTSFAPDGSVPGVDWDPMSTDDPVRLALCDGGEDSGAGSQTNTG
ncbi:MAG: hypothetical protein AAGF94_06375 [Pseudomonadota bacterium]